MTNISFTCKNCGSETFKTASKPKSLNELDDAICARCGAKLTRNQIETQARKHVKDRVGDAIRKARLN